MAKVRKEDIMQLSDADLREKITADRELLQKMRFNHAVSPLDSPVQLRNLRREVARLNTELRRRQLAADAQTDAQ